MEGGGRSGGRRGRGVRGGRSASLHQPDRQGPGGNRGRGRVYRKSSPDSGATRSQPQPRQEQPAGLATRQPSGTPRVEALVATAVCTSKATANRVAALHQLLQALHLPACQQTMLARLQTDWPPLLQLLWDAQPAVCAAAAPIVGAIGALAAQATAAAGPAAAIGNSAGGLLFDWLLPVLSARAAPGGAPLAPHALAAALAALRDCLAGVDPVTLARYANAVLSACQAILEDEATSAEALPSLLGALVATSKHQHSLRARFQDLVDVLLGWALEPSLPAATRAALAETLAAFAPVWQQHTPFARSLLSNLAADLARLASGKEDSTAAAGKVKQEAAGSTYGTAEARDETSGSADAGKAQLAKLLSLAACMAAIADAAPVAAQPAMLQSMLDSLAGRMRRRPSPDPASAVELLACAGRLAAAASKSLATNPAHSASQSAELNLETATTAGAAAVKLSLLELEGGRQVSARLNCQSSAGVDHAVATQMVSAAEHVYASAARLLEAALSLPGVAARPAALAPLLGTQLQWLRFLEQCGSAEALDQAAAAVLASAGGMLLRLRENSKLLQPLGKLLAFLLQYSRTATEQLLADAAQLAAAVHRDTQSEGGASLLFSLRLLHKALPMLPAARAGVVWSALQPAALPDAQLAVSSQALWLELLLVLQAAGDILCKQSPAAAANVLQLQAAILSRGAAEQAIKLHTLNWLQHTAATMPLAAASAAVAPHVMPAAAKSVHAAFTAVQDAAASTDSARVREAALHALATLAASSPGGALLLADFGAAEALYELAVQRLADFSASAAHAAQRLLETVSGLLALRGSLVAEGSQAGCGSNGYWYTMALQPQQHGFTQTQVEQLLSHLLSASDEGPLAATRADAAAEQQEAWLPRLLNALPELPTASSMGSYDGTVIAAKQWTSFSPAAWQAVHELAKHLVSARLRTHLGSATQTLGAMERAVQALAQRLPKSPAAGAGLLAHEQVPQAHLLLLFMLALEQAVANGVHGSSLRPPPPQGATMFFTANEKVCRGWFARMRPGLLRMASALELPHLAVFHGLRRLQELQQQLQAVLPGATAAQKPELAPAPPPSVQKAGTANALSSPATPAPLQPPARVLLQRSKDSGVSAASPAAALMAATRRSPDVANGPAPLGAPAAAGDRRPLSQEQLVLAAAKIGEAAAAVATALCTLRDPAGVRGLQSYCRQAFQPLLQELQQPDLLSAGSPAGAAVGGPELRAAQAKVSAVVEAVSAWEWLSAVELHAAGHYEQAVWQYGGLSSGSRKPFLHHATILHLTGVAYSAVGNAAGLMAWLQQQQQQHSNPRLPTAVGAHLLDLSRWDVAPQESSSERQQDRRSALLQRQRLQGLDGQGSLPLQAACLAELALWNDSPCALPTLPLLSCATDTHGVPFSAWLPCKAEPLAGSAQLFPLGLLLKGCAGRGVSSDELKLPLLLSAASTATAAGNEACSRRMLTVAEALPAATDLDVRLCIQLCKLQQQQPTQQQTCGQHLLELWQLLQEAMSTSPAILQAAASLLVHAAVASPTACNEVPVQQLADVLRGSALPPDLQSRLAPLEQHMQEPRAVGVQYAALKASAASASASAQQWWQLAAWLHDHAAECSAGSPHSSNAVQHVYAAAFGASCRALSMAAGAASNIGSTSSTTVPVLLQLMQLLAQHAASIPADHISSSLSLVPATAWLPVLPQLLAQLAASHDINTERSSSVSARSGLQAVQQVLLAVAEEAPGSVLLPGLVEVGAQQDAGRSSPALQAVVEQVAQRQPDLASQLQHFAFEMACMAVLPEEHWHAVLVEAATLAAKHLAALPKGEQQAELAAAVLAPTLVALQQHLRAANDPSKAATPHEQRFAASVLPRLRQLLQQAQQQALRGAGEAGSAADVSPASWQRVVQLLKRGAAELSTALSQRQLAMADVAPLLARWQGSAIPMPGTDSAGSLQQVTVAGMAAEVAVLHTKTRPKRVTLLGSDGQMYSFLLKGGEDLRTDQRLMQVLHAADATLRAAMTRPRAVAAGSAADALAVHGFTVTPLGDRVGLIQWVDNSIPLYELYTAWHDRQAERAAQLAAVAMAQRCGPAARDTGAAATAAQEAPKPLRPMDQFAAQIKAAGINPASPRERWPLPLLVKALAGLQRTVCRDLIAQELWCGAASAAHWWQRQSHFASSLAAMSMVGWLLGLGDRHLDNMLLHRRHGHVVHIDFNVIFNRGQQLKVPEVVPFRLTQVRSLFSGKPLASLSLASFLPTVLDSALGAGGVEGAFRACSIATLQALRANARPLCVLLETALLDPLVDWNVEGADRRARQSFEEAVALQLFSSRLATLIGTLRSACKAAGNTLASCVEAASDFAHLFKDATTAAATAAESHALQQRCKATLDTAAEQERALNAAAADNTAALDQVLAQVQPLSAEAYACLQECQAWQQRHEAVLMVLATAPPVEFTASASSLWHPAAAPHSLGLVTPASSQSTSVLQAATGVAPSAAPVSASLLLQASNVDARGLQLLSQRAEVCQQLAESVQQYCAAVCFLLGGPAYAHTSAHAALQPAFQAAAASPAPQAFERAVELLPQVPAPEDLLPTWRALHAAAACSSQLTEKLVVACSALRLESVDMGLAAAEAKGRLVDAVAAEPALGRIAQAFADFSEEQATAARALAASEDCSAVLDGLLRLALGYATTAIAVRDASPEQLFAAADGGAAGPLDWLSELVQAADGFHTLHYEVQLLLPALLLLLQSPQHSSSVSAAVAAAAGQAALRAEPDVDAEGSERMQVLLAVAAEQPALAGLLQALQQMQELALQFAGQGLDTRQEQQPQQQHQQQQQQQQDVVKELAKVWAALASAISTDGDVGAPESQLLLCGSVLSSTLEELLQRSVLPVVAARMTRTCSSLHTHALFLAQGSVGTELAFPAGGCQPTIDRPASPQLVPFADFDDLLEQDMLLGELEPPGAPTPLHASRTGGGAGQLGLPSEAAGQVTSGLVPFLDFDASLAGAGELLEPLGGMDGNSAADIPGSSNAYGLLQRSTTPPASQAALSQGGTIEWSPARPTHSDEAPLAGLLAACADAMGSLSAAEGGAYVTSLALQQSRQQEARYVAELALFEWLHEEQLPAEELAISPQLSITAAVAAAAGVQQLEGSPAEAAGWAFVMPRRQLLQNMQDAVNTLLSLEAPLQHWAQAANSLQRHLGEELTGAMPFVAPQLSAVMAAREQWLAAAAGHAANVCRLGQALLQFEASRTALQPGSAAAAAEPWSRYSALLLRMQRVHTAHAAAASAVSTAASELEQLAARRAEAAHIMQSADQAGKAAAAQFAGRALALVKATQALAPALRDLLPTLASCSAHAALLQQVRRQVSLFCLATARLAAGPGYRGAAAAAPAAVAGTPKPAERQGLLDLRSRCAEVQQQLGVAAELLEGLAPALDALHQALLPVRNKLLAGGRGEAAARQQAADVVDGLSAVLTGVLPQLEALESVERQLAALPTQVDALAATAAQQAADLERTGGFRLSGLLPQDGAGAASSGETAETFGKRATALGAGLIPACTRPSQAERQAFATDVLQRVSARLAGTDCSSNATINAADGKQQQSVEEQVEQLIRGATSPENLARMYEGWCAWV